MIFVGKSLAWATTWACLLLVAVTSVPALAAETAPAASLDGAVSTQAGRSGNPRPVDHDLATDLHRMAAGMLREVAQCLAKGANADARDLFGWTPLHYAVAEGQTGVVQLLADSGCDVKGRDGEDCPPLNRSVMMGHEPIAWILLKSGADPCERDGRGYAPLHWAMVRASATKTVQSLIERGAEPAARTTRGETALHLGARFASADVVELLLRSGADPNERDVGGRTPLFAAIVGKKDRNIRILMEYGADASLRDGAGESPREFALRAGLTDADRLLPDAGARATASRQERKSGPGTGAPSVLERDAVSALRAAARRGDLQRVRQLAKEGVDVNARDDSGVLPVMWASMNSDWATVRFLLENGTRVSTSEAETFLRTRWSSYCPDDIRLRLLEAVSDVNRQGASGEALLHLAARAGQVEVVRGLISRGAQANLPDATGCSPLHYAAALGHGAVTSLLLKAGADREMRNAAGDRPLDLALAKGKAETVGQLATTDSSIGQGDLDALLIKMTQQGERESMSLLLARGADARAKDAEGRTALHHAAGWGDWNVLRSLVLKGAEINARDNRGSTPLDQALSRNNWHAVKFFAQQGVSVLQENAGGQPALVQNPALAVRTASSGEEAYQIWSAAQRHGALGAQVGSMDSTSAAAAALILDDLTQGRPGVSRDQLSEIWSFAEQNGAQGIAETRHNALVALGDYSAALENAKHSGDLRRMAECELRLGEREDALRDAMGYLRRTVAPDIPWWSRFLEDLGPSGDEMATILEQSGEIGPACLRHSVLAWARQLASTGDRERALAALRLAYASWPYEDAEHLLQECVRIMKAAGVKLSRICDFLEEQESGNLTVEGDLLAGESDGLSGRARETLTQRLTALTPSTRPSGLYPVFVERGEILQLLGRHGDALREFRAAYRVADFEEMADASGLVPRALKAMDRHFGRSASYLEHLEKGLAVPDSQFGGTGAPFPNDVVADLRDLAAGRRGITDPVKRKEVPVLAMLALGDEREAFEAAVGLLKDSGADGPSSARAVELIGVCIKAHDGHTLRANRYLAYQREKAAGAPASTGEDMLSEVLHEIRR